MKKGMIKNLVVMLSFIFGSTIVVACGKKDEVKKVTETTLNADVIDDVDNGKDKEVIDVYEDAESVGEFLYRQKDQDGNITSIVVFDDKDLKVKTFTYNALDLEENYDSIAALTIDFDNKVIPDKAKNLISEDEDNVIIKAGGIYQLKGTLKNKRIKVVEGIGNKVQLVFDGLIIDTDKDSAVLSTEKCFTQIFLADGSTNEIKLHRDNKNKSKDENNAVIYSEEPLIFTGSGKLIVDSEFECSVQSAEKVTFISGEYIFNTKGDAIKAKKDIIFREGSFDITSGDDAVKSLSSKSACIYVENANLKIASGDKGLSSDNELFIAGGNIDIDSKGESVGGKIVNIVGGKINIKSGDDGINASDSDQNKKDDQKGVKVLIMGGEINIDSPMDGIDSNGDLDIIGGKLFIDGSDNDNERIIDYNGKVKCGEVEMIAVGPAAKMQDLGEKPTQSYIIVYYKDKESSKIELKDKNDNVILSHIPRRTYKAAIISSANLENGETYKIVNNSKELNVKLKEGKNEVWEK